MGLGRTLKKYENKCSVLFTWCECDMAAKLELAHTFTASYIL